MIIRRDPENDGCVIRRSIITADKYNKHKFVITHTGLNGHAATYNNKKATEAFDKLNTDKNLNDDQKKMLINQILYYVADTTPYKRGTAAIAQMMYHALEKKFLGTYSCFGMPKSEYGYASGLQYDIIAMMSPNFESFQNYFIKNILDRTINVTDLADECADIDKELLLDGITQLNSDLDLYIEERGKIYGISDPELNKANRLKDTLIFLRKELTFPTAQDKSSIASIQKFIEVLKKTEKTTNINVSPKF